MRRALLLVAGLICGAIAVHLLTPERPATVEHVETREAPQPVAAPELLTDGAPRRAPSRSAAGRIRGRVTTSEGAPLAGAAVESIPHGAERARRRAGTRRATTDADGRYTLGDVPAGPHRIEASHARYQVRAVQADTARRAKAGDTVDFIAQPVVRLTVDVLGPDGQPVERAVVVRAVSEEALSRADGWSWTPGRRTRSVEPGPAWIQARADHETGLASEPREVALVHGRDHEVTLRLRQQLGIRGRVIFPDGEAPKRAEVWIVPLQGQGATLLDGVGGWRTGRRARFDRQSLRYSAWGLEPGRHGVALVVEHEVAARADVTVWDGPVEQDLEMPTTDRKTYTTVHVRGPDGQPLDEREVSIETSFHAPKVLVGGGGRVLHDPDGSWRVRPLAHEYPRHGTHVVRVRWRKEDEEAGTREVVFVPGQAAPVTIDFVEPVAVTLTFPTVPGAVCTQLGVYLQAPRKTTGFSLWGSPVPIDGQGRAAFAGVQPGRYEVMLVYLRTALSPALVARIPIEIQGAGEVPVVLPSLHDLVVEVTAHETSVQLQHIGDDGHRSLRQHGAPDDEGRVTFPLVPAGHYVVTRYDRTRQQRFEVEVEVPRQTLVRLE